MLVVFRLEYTLCNYSSLRVVGNTSRYYVGSHLFMSKVRIYKSELIHPSVIFAIPLPTSTHHHHRRNRPSHAELLISLRHNFVSINAPKIMLQRNIAVLNVTRARQVPLCLFVGADCDR